MQKSFNFFYAFLLAILGFGATLMAEDITLTTYYPAPYGAYDELTITGNVGIGTTAPVGTNAKLAVTGGAITIGASPLTADASLHITNSYGGFDRLTQINPIGNSKPALNLMASTNAGGVAQWWVWGVNNNIWSIQPGTSFAGSAGLFIDGSGSVGIGTTNPGAYKLYVNGSTYINGDVVTDSATYPDYVFEPGYKLMNIVDVKNYVLENKHLPNMPSSEEIKTDGVKIFKQNRLLLEKLEEAYLHIFQLEERIAKLERR